MAACKQRPRFTRATIPAAGYYDVAISTRTVELLLRVVDATRAPVDFTVAPVANPDQAFSFAAGEAYQEERLSLADALTLRVTATAAEVVELIAWEEL